MSWNDATVLRYRPPPAFRVPKLRSQVAHTRDEALYFIQLVLYAFGALENFALTIQTAVHGTSRAADETAGATA